MSGVLPSGVGPKSFGMAANGKILDSRILRVEEGGIIRHQKPLIPNMKVWGVEGVKSNAN